MDPTAPLPQAPYYEAPGGYQPPLLPGYFTPINCYSTILHTPTPHHHPHHHQPHHQPPPHLTHYQTQPHHSYNHQPTMVDLTDKHQHKVVMQQQVQHVDQLSLQHPQLQQLPLAAPPPQALLQHGGGVAAAQHPEALCVVASSYASGPQWAVSMSNTMSLPATTATQPTTTAPPARSTTPTNPPTSSPNPSRLSNTSNPQDRVKKKLACTQCDFFTYNKKTLANHTSKHTGLGLYTCPHCPFNSAYLGTFKRHLIRKHNNAPESGLKRERLQCPHCPFVTIYKKNMKKHIAKHTGEGVHKCKHCDYVTAYIAGFKKHMLKHAKPEVFTCKHCDYTTTWKGFFDRHLTSKHPDKSGFSCPQCPFVGRSKRALKTHVLKHPPVEGGEGLQCSEGGCDFTTTDPNALQCHNRQHLEIKMAFQCPHCPYKTNLKGLFKIHTYTHSSPAPGDAGSRTGDSSQQMMAPKSLPDLVPMPPQVPPAGVAAPHGVGTSPHGVGASPLAGGGGGPPKRTQLQALMGSNFPIQGGPPYGGGGGGGCYGEGGGEGDPPKSAYLGGSYVQNSTIIQGADLNYASAAVLPRSDISLTNSGVFRSDLNGHRPELNVPNSGAYRSDLNGHNSTVHRSNLSLPHSTVLRSDLNGPNSAVLPRYDINNSNLAIQRPVVNGEVSSELPRPAAGGPNLDQNVTSKKPKSKKPKKPNCQNYVPATEESSSAPSGGKTASPGGRKGQKSSSSSKGKPSSPSRKRGSRGAPRGGEEGCGGLEAPRNLCEHCNFSTNSTVSLRRHASRHTRDPVHVCLECGLTAECETSFLRHLETHETAPRSTLEARGRGLAVEGRGRTSRSTLEVRGRAPKRKRRLQVEDLKQQQEGQQEQQQQEEQQQQDADIENGVENNRRQNSIVNGRLLKPKCEGVVTSASTISGRTSDLLSDDNEGSYCTVSGSLSTTSDSNTSNGIFSLSCSTSGGFLTSSDFSTSNGSNTSVNSATSSNSYSSNRGFKTTSSSDNSTSCTKSISLNNNSNMVSLDSTSVTSNIMANTSNITSNNTSVTSDISTSSNMTNTSNITSNTSCSLGKLELRMC